jgi:hypothetical protein
VVRLRDASIAELDGRVAERSDWAEVQLLPGKHQIRWESGLISGGDSAEVTLEAGHVYALRAARTHNPWRYEETYFWISDETTGEVIAGAPKP